MQPLGADECRKQPRRGAHALVAREVGLNLDAEKLDRAFHSAWKQMPLRPAIDGPREDDDKGWWRELVDLIFAQVDPNIADLDRDNFFEVAYEQDTLRRRVA